MYRRMLIHAPAIAKLFGRPRLWANRRISAGRYGPVIHSGRSHLVDIGAVEAAEGVRFAPAQLAAVGLIQPQSSKEAA